MAQNNVDLCNPLAVWQLFIQFLTGPAPGAAPSPQLKVSGTRPPPILLEPDLDIRKEPATGKFLVGKPDYTLDDLSVRPNAEFKVVDKFPTRADAEAFKRTIPRIRLPGRLRWRVDEKDTWRRLQTPRFDWPIDPEAERTGERLAEILDRIPLYKSLPDNNLVTLNMALLPPGRRGQFTPNPPSKSVILIDPEQMEKGMLEMAAIYIHELTHAKFYYDRGFTIRELSSLLSRDEYLLVYLYDELAGFDNGVAAVKEFLASCPDNLKKLAKPHIFDHITRPMGFPFFKELESKPPSFLEDISRKEVRDLYLLTAEEKYDEESGKSRAPNAAAQAWVTSPEWTKIQQTLPLWQRAGVL